MTARGWLVKLIIILGGCCWSLPSFSMQLMDGKSFIYDIGKNGVLNQGTLNAYKGMYRLRVNGANYIGEVVGLSAQGRQVHLSVFTEPRSGLEIERRVYVSRTNHFARYTEILRNPTSAPISVEVEVYGRLGSGQQTTILSNQTDFLITDDMTDQVSGSMPTLLHNHSQVNRPVAATHSVSGDELRWIFHTVPTEGDPVNQITIPAQTQLRLIYFVAQTNNADEAYAIADFIFSNPTALYEGMTFSEISELLNFLPPHPTPPAEEMDAPFLNPGEVRNGILEDSDPLSSVRAMTPADRYAINLAKNQQITLRMSASFNTYLYLFDDIKGTTRLATNDDQSTDQTNSEIVFTAPEDRTYYIEATAHNRAERGAYTLEVKEGANNIPPQAYHFEFDLEKLTAPATVTLTDFSIDPDGTIAERCWQFNDDTPLTCDASNTITHTFEQPGRYSVGLTLRDDKNAYAHHNEQISVSASSSEVVLPISNTIAGELASSDSLSYTRSNAFTDRYLISGATVGQELVIDLQSDDFDSYLYLYDEFNRLLRQDDNSGGGNHARIRFTPVYDGNFVIEATSLLDNTPGKYRLSLARADNSTEVKVPIEALTFLGNPLKNLLIARVPDHFAATFFQWNFGDNSAEVSTDNAVVSHTYPRKGRFTVTVTATNNNKQSANGSRTLTVNDQVYPPQSRFRASPLFGESPLRVFFTNEADSQLPGDDLSYLWRFGDGNISTAINPAHTFLQEGSYHVVLETFSTLTQQSASYGLPITVIDRSSTNVPVSGITRLRPQVLMAGFDPMLIDLLDTDFKVFAIVRPGGKPIQTVQLTQNDGKFLLVMQQVATYPNGDQRYEAVYTFAKGSLPVTTFTALFGDQPGQLRIQAIDQSGQFHAFPDLEIGNNLPLEVTPKSIHIEPLRRVGVRRTQPQVLAAGFDPALVDNSDTSFKVEAIVREGLFPTQQVLLQQNQSEFSLPMRWIETFPNGDKLYVIAYTYPYGGLAKGTLRNLLGDQAGQFMIQVVDQAQQTHRFPEVKIGNFPSQ